MPIYLKVLFLFVFISVSPSAYAANIVPWKSYLFVVMGLSLVIASVLSWRNPKADSRLGKLLLAGLYFWVLTFAQLIVLALIYHFYQ